MSDAKTTQVTSAHTPVPIRLDAVSKGFHHAVKGEIFAVKDVSINVQPGELLTLLGPSGCGKTTTLRMIAGFEQPTRGHVYIGEHNVTGLRASERNIGFVFQEPTLMPWANAFDNVHLPLKIKGASRSSARVASPPGAARPAVASSAQTSATSACEREPIAALWHPHRRA